ncbi:MAG TPA: hypothetical protein VK892_19615, partial [Pyrinomonadaceae bacterium]|nr:hypothetical protein [Pyrinomonadaceae bacterium]
LSLLVIVGLVATTNFSVLAQSQSSEVKNPQRSDTLLKKEALLKFGVNPEERVSQLLDKDYLTTIKAESLSSKAMQDAGNAQQKKKFAGIGTTTAIIIGAGIAAAIIIVLAAKGNSDNNSPCRLSGITTPCPPGCVCI